MFRKVLHFAPLILISILGIGLIFVGVLVHQRHILIEEFLIHPSKQLNTVWKNNENDVVFVVGDGKSSNNFRTFIFWNGEYIEGSLTCDYSRQAELAIPGENGIVSRYDGATYLAVGTFHISEDAFLIELDESLSSKEFIGERNEIILQRFSGEEIENDVSLQQLVLNLGLWYNMQMTGCYDTFIKVRDAVQYHHGTLMMESEENKGTTISVLFKN